MAVMLRLPLLLVLAASVCCLPSVSGKPEPAIKYQAFSDLGLSNLVLQTTREPAASSGPVSFGPRPPSANSVSEPHADLRRNTTLHSSEYSPSDTSSTAFWNRRGAIAFPLIERLNVREDKQKTKTEAFSPVSNFKHAQRPQRPPQRVNGWYNPTPSPQYLFMPTVAWKDFETLPVDKENALKHRATVKTSITGSTAEDPSRIGAAQGEWPTGVFSEIQTEQTPSAIPSPSRDQFSWVRDLSPGFFPDGFFAAPCRISRSDPPPNEPLFLLEEITGTTWQFPRTVQELAGRLMYLAYKRFDDNWDLIKLLARDAVDHALWEFVTEEEVDQASGFLSQIVVRKLNHLTSSVHRWFPKVPYLDVQQLLPQPRRVTRRFDTGCPIPNAKISMLKIGFSKWLTIVIHGMTNGTNVSDSVLRYQRRSIDERVCGLTILGFRLDGVSALCRDFQSESRHPWQQPSFRAKRSLATSFHPFSVVVKAWNNFETDHYPIYDTLTRMLNSVLSMLIVILFICLGISFASFFANDVVHHEVDRLETLTETVQNAIHRNEMAFEGDVAEVAGLPLETHQPRPSDYGIDEQTEATVNGHIPAGITPHVEESPMPDDKGQKAITKGVPQDTETLQASANETDSVLDLVRALLAGGEVGTAQHGADAETLFPLSLRTQRDATDR